MDEIQMITKQTGMNKQYLVLLKILLSTVLLLFVILSCGPTKNIREFSSVSSYGGLNPQADYMKVHTKEGSLYLLQSWHYNENLSLLTGNGNLFDHDRKIVVQGARKLHDGSNVFDTTFRIMEKDIALIETNSLDNMSGNLSAITIVGVPFGLLSMFCIIDPKACFGSCPTFYAYDGEDTLLMAEGFSSSILKVFEKKDIDMLYWAKKGKPYMNIRLTNEALETHVIRYADLLAFPVKNDERVFATKDGRFFKTSHISSPASCIAEEGDCLSLVANMDHTERFSMADSRNLAKREFIEFSFKKVTSEEYGLIIGSRQTLMTTFLFYQGMAYMGTQAGSYAARIESGDKDLEKRVKDVWDLLGSIEVLMENENGRWEKVNEIDEMGPIAADVHLVNLPKSISENINLRLRLTKGLWRIDYLALAKIDGEVTPERIKPAFVKGDMEVDDDVCTLLHDTIKPLVTFPGERYELMYNLPEGENFEMFIESKGYYLEWMRDEWLAEENLKMAALMFTFPKLYMRMVAPDFKDVEPSMEDKFWGSRYVKK